MDSFVHLHVHSGYSLLDGAAPVEALVERAASLGMPALALTDHGVLHGAVEFYRACRRQGIKPVLGCEVYVAPRSRMDREGRADRDPHHLLLLCENETGYHNLLQLVSRAYLEGFYYKPRVDEDLLTRYSEGLLCLTGCLGSAVPQAIVAGQLERARRTLERYLEIFGAQNLYLELQDHGLEREHTVNRQLETWASEYDLQLVATNDVHYNERADAAAHDVLLAIQTAKNVSDEDRLRFPNDEFYLKTPAEMETLFRSQPQALANTLAIAERCNVELDFDSQHLPAFQVPEGETPSSYLRQLCKQGARKRYPEAVEEAGHTVWDRLEYELETIEDMGFSSYFLITWDLIRHAREQGIPVGPGRGSAAGSLVAYCLKITDVDPLEYKLPFERFLNPERVTMPDIDIDFCYQRRDEVIQYTVERYGQQNVAQICTFGTLAARAAVRDVGRALGMPYGQVDRIAKLVPYGDNLAEALEEVKELRGLYQQREEVQRLLDVSRQLEGLPRHVSTHAAGVVITGEPLVEYVPLMKTGDDVVVTQLGMNDLEKLGLLKMDFLGLRTLTVMHNCVELVNQHRPGENLELDRIPLDDPATYQRLRQGDTTGMFQLESRGMQELLRELRPDHFEDIVAAVALFRPGPMENIPDFVHHKHQGQGEYLHPDLEPLLKDTYGIMIYQEQIMAVAVEMAGFTPGQADILRRAMGKKDAALLQGMQERFIQGCTGKGYSQQLARELYALVEKFAGYGFSRCHSVPYALLAYQTAYLKVHYPAEFMAALMNSFLDQTDKVGHYVHLCRLEGIEVLPPDINESGSQFVVAGGRIRFGLAAVKNVGRSATDALMRERQENGPFESLFDLVSRVGTRVLNRRMVESLIKAGALDSTGALRSQMIAGLDQVMDVANRREAITAGGQLSLFETAAGEGEHALALSVDLPQVPALSFDRKLALEKEVLGLYASGHPLEVYGEAVSKIRTVEVAGLADLDDGSPVVLAAMAAVIRYTVTRRDERMCFLTLEDPSGQVEAVVFPRVFEDCWQQLEEGGAVAVAGRLERSDDRQQVIADAVLPLAAVDLLYVECNCPPRQAFQELRPLLPGRRQGLHPIFLYWPEGKQLVRIDSRWWAPDAGVLAGNLEEHWQRGRVKVQPAVPSRSQD